MCVDAQWGEVDESVSGVVSGFSLREMLLEGRVEGDKMLDVMDRSGCELLGALNRQGQ